VSSHCRFDRRGRLFAVLLASGLALAAPGVAQTPAPDGDGDGVPDASDTCPTLKAGSYDKDANGCPGPFEEFAVGFAYRTYDDGRLRFLLFSEVPATATFVLRCSRCPEGKQRITQRPPVSNERMTKTLRRLKYVRAHRKTMVITITGPGLIGKHITLRFNARAQLPASARTARCLQPGSSTPRRTCDTTPGVAGGEVH